MTPVYWLDGRRRGNKAFSPVVRHGNPARSVDRVFQTVFLIFVLTTVLFTHVCH